MRRGAFAQCAQRPLPILRASGVAGGSAACYGPAMNIHKKTMRLAALAAAALLAARTGYGETLAERLLAAYDGVKSVSCEVRREMRSEGAPAVRTLSRVHWQRGDRLNVETVTPLPRRIVADGAALFSYIDGDPMGFSRPVDQLDPDWLLSLRKIPGTPTEHLLRLKGVAEEELPGTAEFPVRRGYQAERIYAVLCLDASNRLARLEFYRDAGRQDLVAHYRFIQFEEKAGVPFVLRQEAVLRTGEVEAHETTQVLRLEVNQPQPGLLFQPDRFFKKVTFTGDMKEIYK